MERSLVGWVTGESDRKRELAFINTGVTGDELMLRSVDVRLWHGRKVA
jgi:hypothetical protein